ncbi:MAG: (2Fe-2S)-binding protein [Candidatus Hodarchaeota archaeon]
MRTELFVNGILIEKEVSPERRLLDFLREDLGLKGTKKGCDQGECGACSILLNGEVVNSCLVLMSQLTPRSEITTIESTDPLVTALQDSFVHNSASQCGICTPGMIIAATALLKDNPNANDEDIRQGLSGVLCRCTGYTKIIEAVKNTKISYIEHEDL